MGAMKIWFEDRISEFTDKELLEMGFKQDDIYLLRECFTSKGS